MKNTHHMIDTLRITKRLINAKTKQDQAEILADIFKEREEVHFDKLATKDDVYVLKTRISSIKNQIDSLKSIILFGCSIVAVLMTVCIGWITILLKNIGG
jgi:cob(I)alamin adenosyltransferase